MEEDRGTGKTTELMEEAVRLLAILPEGQNVYVTGAHTRHLNDLEREFKEAGLVDVVFLAKTSIMYNGALRGRRGILLIDDLQDMTFKEQELITMERDMLGYS